MPAFYAFGSGQLRELLSGLAVKKEYRDNEILVLTTALFTGRSRRDRTALYFDDYILASRADVLELTFCRAVRTGVSARDLLTKDGAFRILLLGHGVQYTVDLFKRMPAGDEKAQPTDSTHSENNRTTLKPRS